MLSRILFSSLVNKRVGQSVAVAACAGLLTLCASNHANAQTLLLPGESTLVGGAPAGFNLNDTSRFSLLASSEVTGSSGDFPPPPDVFDVTFRGAVYRDLQTQQLTFIYQVSNDEPLTSDRFIGRFEAAGSSAFSSTFAPFTTSVFFLDGDPDGGGIFENGTISPYAADRSGDGEVVGFLFADAGSTTGADGRVGAGQTSSTLVIQTDAVNYSAGVASVITPSSNAQLFAPTIIPEPGAFALALPAIGGLALAHRRRKP